MVSGTVARHARPMHDADTIQRLRAEMARRGAPVDDLEDDELVDRARALVPDYPDSVGRVLRTLTEHDPDEAEYPPGLVPHWYLEASRTTKTADGIGGLVYRGARI
jgi:hypothetical protein